MSDLATFAFIIADGRKITVKQSNTPTIYNLTDEQGNQSADKFDDPTEQREFEHINSLRKTSY